VNEQERSELEALKRRQTELQQELTFLGRKLVSLEQRLDRPIVIHTSPAPPPIIPRPIAPVPETILPQTPQTNIPMATPLPDELAQQAEPVFAQRLSKQTTPEAPLAAPEAESIFASTARAAAPPPIPPTKPTFTASSSPSPKNGSFEMRLGTFWLVRIGIVMLLTGLVFFGNYAYQNLISKFGPLGKVSLLYLASIGLLVAGWWWQRNAVKETLRNYAQVVFAGGLAAFYFTTFAAHYFKHLRVITSAAVDGTLLLLWAGFIVWIADRKKSEVLALFAILLAYYTAIISRDVGLFTLYSNLLLTIAAVYFMVRNRWAKLSFASLTATYASYTFWRFLHTGEWGWAYPGQQLWTGTLFLMSYWAVFTAAVFLSRNSNFSKENRSSFLTLNNGAFFALFLLTMLQVHQGGFWKFALVYGVVLIALAALAKVLLPTEALTRNAYLTQGLLLATTGLISHPRLAGLNLALVLAVESMTLLMAGQMRKNLVLIAGAYITAGLSVIWGMDGMLQHEPHGLWLGMGLGTLMLANTLIAHRGYVPLGISGKTEPPVSATPITFTRIHSRVAYFALLALGIWFVATKNNTSAVTFPLILAAEGLLLTLSIYVLDVHEITFLAQIYLVLSHCIWGFRHALPMSDDLPWHNPILMIGITLATSHWWQRQKRLVVRSDSRLFFQGLYALGIVAVLYLWLEAQVTGETWLALSGFMALVVTAYAVLTRAWMLAACAQFLVVVASLQFANQLLRADPRWFVALAPIAVLVVLSSAAIEWFRRNPRANATVQKPVLQLALVYRVVALAMSIWWVAKYIPERERIWVYALLGLLTFAFAGWRRTNESLVFSAAFTICALILFWIPDSNQPAFYLPTLLALIAPLAEQRMVKRFPERFAVSREMQGAAIIVGGLSIWMFVSHWVLSPEYQHHAYLTASWSVVALILFGCGILTRERVYRWVGLGILACAIGRVVFVDVWKLDVIYRVLSFMALGVVLLVLGFIYSKYQEKIREWL
jgi:uncharacterized membrane protein